MPFGGTNDGGNQAICRKRVPCLATTSWRSPLSSRSLLVTTLAFLFQLLPYARGQPPRYSEVWRLAEFNTESGLPSDHVYTLIETEAGVPWVVTSGGVAWYDEYRWRGTPFPASPPLSKPSSLHSTSREQVVVVLDSLVYVGDTLGFRALPFSSILSAATLPNGDLILLRQGPGTTRQLATWNGHSLEPVALPAMISLGMPSQLFQSPRGTTWLCAGHCLFSWDTAWHRRLCVKSDAFPLLVDHFSENTSGHGIMLAYRPLEAKGLWEWNDQQNPSLSSIVAAEGIRAMDIAPDRIVLAALESGHYVVKNDNRWATLPMHRPSARTVEMLKFRNNGDLWLCTSRGLFLDQYSSERWRFVVDNASPSHNLVNDILLASDGSLWIATGGGIKIIKPNGDTRIIDRILDQPIYVTTGVLEDRENNIWVCSGSSFTGVRVWNGVQWRSVGKGTPLERSQIHRMRLDKRGRIWLLGIPNVISPSPQIDGPGAFVYDHGTITRWGVEQGMGSSRVYAFEEGPDSSYWFGTMAGISMWKSGTWRHWTSDDLFSAGRCFTLAIDHENELWFSDARGVVGRIDRDGAAHRVTVEDGLPSEEVWEIRTDAKGRVWCTTPEGLALYSYGCWMALSQPWGLSSTFLWPVLPSDDKVYVGSHSGLGILNLSEIEQASAKLVLNQTLTSSSSALVSWRVFPRWAKVPEGAFVTRFRLGRSAWSAWTAARETTIQDINPGEHTFELQLKPLIDAAAAHSTVTGTFQISLPIVQDPRFVVPSIIVVVTMFALVLGIATHARRLKQEQLFEELRREHEHAERLAEVDKIKSRFFANISHEFRTPLTLILGPTDQLLSQIGDRQTREKLLGVYRNAEKLHTMINQLLDFSRIEAGTMQLAVRKGDLVSFIHRVVRSFQSWAEQKKQQLKFDCSAASIEGFFDADNLEKILNNLISNALKFTPEHGEIVVSVCLISELVSARTAAKITVRDTGVGIKKEHLPHIFERFYRVDDSHRTEGTGIGLALTKELVDLHHGSITVQSRRGKGTEFTVTLPLVSYPSDEIATVPLEETQDILSHPRVDVFDPVGEEHEAEEVHKTIVLVVEDSADVRAYVREYLVAEYSVLEAENGVEALEKARAVIPDLVVSDIMMPEMNGYELCTALKQDERTSHIPVILLTARAGTENKIEGLELGADDYLTKPFDAKELLTRIRNLTESRRKLREKFSKTAPLKPGEVAVTSMDDAFLKKAIDTVERHIADEDFSVEQFSKEMAMSRMQLHRKLRALTNQPAGEFIRQLRLYRAHELLHKHTATVSEIAFQTGFGSVSHFTRCYHEQFGCTPTETSEHGVKKSV